MTTLNMYDSFIRDQLKSGQIDLEDTGTYTFKIALVTAAYSPTSGTDDFWDDVSANEVSGTNYTAGGNAITSPTVSLAGGTITFDAADPATWAQSGAGFSNSRRAIVYADSGTPGTSRLICYSDDFGSDKGNVAGNLTVTISATGIFTAT